MSPSDDKHVKRDDVLTEAWGRLFGGVDWRWVFILGLAVRVTFVFLANNNGTDAWTRYEIAGFWLTAPGHLPSEVWPPLHFWILGTGLWIWKSEWAARLLTAAFGSLTILPYWGLLRRVFGRGTALWSILFFALFGFHVAYSVTTSSEGPTIFFLVLGFYGWVRFLLSEGWPWLLVGGAGFSAASLCRYEVWIMIPLLAVCTLAFSGRGRGWLNRRTWIDTVSFALSASIGAMGWMLYNLRVWGDPLAAAKRNAFTAKYLQPHHSLVHRLIAVPGALIVTLSPLFAVLVSWGLWEVVRRTQVPQETLKRALAAVALFLVTLQIINSVHSNLTMARFTLMYSWLLIPYAFEALRVLLERWRVLEPHAVVCSAVVLFLLWQAGSIIGAYYGPPEFASRLSSVAPTLPLDPELRDLTHWLKTHRKSGDQVVVDQYNYEAVDIIRYSNTPFSEALPVTEALDLSTARNQFIDFLDRRRPRLLIYCPKGMLGNLWPLGDQNESAVPELAIRLRRLWRGERYRVYEIEFSPDSHSQSSTEN